MCGSSQIFEFKDARPKILGSISRGYKNHNLIKYAVIVEPPAGFEPATTGLQGPRYK